MSKWNIWCDGFQDMECLPSPIQVMAYGVEAETFKEACLKHFKNDSYYDPTRGKYGTYWALTLAPSLLELAQIKEGYRNAGH